MYRRFSDCTPVAVLLLTPASLEMDVIPETYPGRRGRRSTWLTRSNICPLGHTTSLILNGFCPGPPSPSAAGSGRA